MNGWDVRRMVQQILHLVRREVRYTNVSCVVLLNEQDHGTPCVDVIDVLAAEPAVLDWPMHVVEVEVSDA